MLSTQLIIPNYPVMGGNNLGSQCPWSFKMNYGGGGKVERNGEWSKERTQPMCHCEKEDRGWKETRFQNYKDFGNRPVFQRHFGWY